MVAAASTAACQGGLPSYAGSAGSVGGTWVGTIDEAETGLASPFVMWLEQVGDGVTGVLGFPEELPAEEDGVPFAEQGAACDVADGLIVDGGLSFRFVTGEVADILYAGAYDAATETLSGEWAVDSSIGSYAGAFEVTRISWETARWINPGVTYLGCSDLPVSECFDGMDNDGDGATDFDDPFCDPSDMESTEDVVSSCEDGMDNDGDGLVDTEDVECPAADLGLEAGLGG